METKLQQLKEHISKIEEFQRMTAIIYWDMKICMPKKALEQRAKTLSVIDSEAFKLLTGSKTKEFLEYFSSVIDKLEPTDKAMIRKLKKEYDLVNKIPEKLYNEYSMIKALSEAAWEEAREKDDFSIFEPHLEKIVEFERRLTEYYGYEDNKYDALLGRFEEGMTVKKLDKLFGQLKDGILELLKYVKESHKKTNLDFLHKSFDIEKQKELSQYLLDVIKFDKESGRLDETTHPFTTNFGNKDVRITTHYYESDLLSNLFSIIHEGGHGLYELNIKDNLLGTGLAEGASMGIHESQSRFYENIIGRSKEFLSVIFQKIKEIFPSFEDVSLDDFYKAVNNVEPSLIRTEADELTYSLHIIIRYEIEKKLINGEIEVKDLPRIWKEKYIEYLGVEPKTDSEGIIQDMHWSDGSFGYFPSYALGNLYGGQFLNKMLKDNKDVFSNLEKTGDITYINEWLSNNIHQFGSIYTPSELIKKVTGEELSSKYFLDYLNNKYKKIY